MTTDPPPAAAEGRGQAGGRHPGDRQVSTLRQADDGGEPDCPREVSPEQDGSERSLNQDGSEQVDRASEVAPKGRCDLASASPAACSIADRVCCL